MNTWIVPFSWSYFAHDGYLQPLFTLTPGGKLHLERCNLLDKDMVYSGVWLRADMSVALIRDLEKRAKLECFPPLPGIRIPVSLQSKKLGR